ncbi:MAG: hypothetical protein ACHREM_28100, partial [Polyangiales bacterium]
MRTQARRPSAESTTHSRISGSNSQGSMTIAMRAIAATDAPKILRVGRVEAGRVVEERVFPRGADVTVGTHHGCAFVVAGAIAGVAAPERASLFSCDASGWSMLNDDRVEGRIAIASGVTDVRQLRALARTSASRVPIGDDGRGKVSFAGSTYLFQLVTPPPVQPKPQLPLTVRSRAGQGIDWAFTMVAACSFLLHFGLAGFANSDALDPTVDEDADAIRVIQQAKDRPQIEPESQPTSESKEPTKVAKNDPPAKPTPTARPGAMTDPHPGRSEPARRPSVDASSLSTDLAAISMKTIGVFDHHGPASTEVAGPGTAPVDSALDEISKRGTSVSTTDQGMRVAAETGPMSPGDHTRCFACSTPPRSTPPVVATPAPTVAPPSVPMPVPMAPEGPAPKGTDTVIARLRFKFRACLAKELNDNPEGGGTIRVRVKIGEN